MRRGIMTGLVLVPLALSLAGCGYDRGDRALSGGLIGAGGGAAIAAVTTALFAIETKVRV